MSSGEDLIGAESERGSSDAAARRLSRFVEEVVIGLDLTAEVEIAVTQGQLTAVVSGPDLSALIGHQGSTLDAVQYLAQRIVFAQRDHAPRIVVDADGYRALRAQALVEVAEEASEEAVRSGGAVVLEPMPAAERRVIHEHLADRDDVLTHSEGDEPRRHLVISPVE